jgi:hypothetical protein
VVFWVKAVKGAVRSRPCQWLAISALMLAGSAPLPAVAQTITDGDTLKIGGATYRLWGIDAPEAKQECPDSWPAGRMATTRLLSLTSGKRVDCQEKDRDRYGRVVAICRVAGEDLGAILVREGFAWHSRATATTMLLMKRGLGRRRSGSMPTTACQPGSGGRSSVDSSDVEQAAGSAATGSSTRAPYGANSIRVAHSR